MSFAYKDTLVHVDTKLINSVYSMPLGELLEVDKSSLRHFLTRTKLVCRWLEGILDLIAELENTELDREGK